MALQTDYEQLMLELVNRARLDPEGEAERYGIDLNENLAARYYQRDHQTTSCNELSADRFSKGAQSVDDQQRCF